MLGITAHFALPSPLYSRALKQNGPYPMIHDGTHIAAGEVRAAQVCIAGAGAAGVPLAL